MVASSVGGLPSSDSEPYLQTVGIDANLHQSASYTDALGRTAYTQRFSGSSQSPAGAGISSYALTSYNYDGAGNLTRITDAQGHTTTFGYDQLGREVSLADPDRGSETYSYDASGNVTTTVDARGSSSGAIYAGYDGLSRQLWRNSSNSPSGAYASYSYDATANGNDGKGRLTGESFAATGGTGLGSGSYSSVYDSRGRTTSSTLTVNGTSYPVGASYTDFDALASQTYPSGETLTTSYNATGAPLGLSRTPSGGGSATTLWDLPVYSTAAQTAGMLSSARIAQTYTFAPSYDGDLRTSDRKYTRTSDGSTVYEEALGYDNIGNVSSTTVTLPAGTVASHFCYDEQDRLTWAGTTGTPPCTGSAITGTTISSAQYVIPYGYDTLDRLTSSWNGSYTYGDSAHLHGVTSIGTNYSASYDAAGNMTCRAPTSSTTCAGSSPTGAQLGYDNEGRLVTWQNAPTNPTTTAKYLYDGEGERVEGQVTSGSTTTTTLYVGGLQDVVTTGGTTTTTSYYALGDAGTALSTNGGSLSYQATDHLGSADVTLDGSGNVTGSRLYDPYGNGSYSSGTMPGSYGFTGQHSDVGTTGLDYYHARYYDPTAGQFGSADTVRDGQSRYAYVQGKPETATDPSGHFCGEEAGCGDGNAAEATGFAGNYTAAADALYTDEAEAEAQVEAQVEEEAQAGERAGPGGAEAAARAELAASDSPELLDEEMRGDELQHAADEREARSTPPGNGPQNGDPSQTTNQSQPPANQTPTVQSTANSVADQQEQFNQEADAKGWNAPCAGALVCETDDGQDPYVQGNLTGSDNKPGRFYESDVEDTYGTHTEAKGLRGVLRRIRALAAQSYQGRLTARVITGLPSCTGCRERIPGYVQQAQQAGNAVGIDVDLQFYYYRGVDRWELLP